MKPIPTILYVNCRPEYGIDGRRLAGMRRYAAGRGWRVETLELGTATPPGCARNRAKAQIARVNAPKSARKTTPAPPCRDMGPQNASPRRQTRCVHFCNGASTSAMVRLLPRAPRHVASSGLRRRSVAKERQRFVNPFPRWRKMAVGGRVSSEPGRSDRLALHRRHALRILRSIRWVWR